jgi:hypothetical protein
MPSNVIADAGVCNIGPRYFRQDRRFKGLSAIFPYQTKDRLGQFYRAIISHFYRIIMRRSSNGLDANTAVIPDSHLALFKLIDLGQYSHPSYLLLQSFFERQTKGCRTALGQFPRQLRLIRVTPFEHPYSRLTHTASQSAVNTQPYEESMETKASLPFATSCTCC